MSNPAVMRHILHFYQGFWKGCLAKSLMMKAFL